LEQASEAVDDISPAKISRIETGRVSARPSDVDALLTAYRITDKQHRANLLTLTRESRQRAWWGQFSDVMLPGQDVLIGLETEAVFIRIFSPNVVSGLFQTEQYARALLAADLFSKSPSHLERRIALRLERQKILNDPDRLKVHAVIDESVLYRPVGGSEVLRAQLRRLIDFAQSSNISIRVLPISIGAHVGSEGAFRILDLALDPPVVHIEHPVGATYVETDEGVGIYRKIFGRLERAALTSRQSISLIKKISEGKDNVNFR
jgi:hypothetical protein